MTVRPSFAERTEECDEVEALHGVGAVQRLVEHEHLRVGDEGGGDLRALPHALAESTHAVVATSVRLTISWPDRLPAGDAVQVGDA
jgi:hypothetical protein